MPSNGRRRAHFGQRSWLALEARARRSRASQASAARSWSASRGTGRRTISEVEAAVSAGGGGRLMIDVSARKCATCDASAAPRSGLIRKLELGPDPIPIAASLAPPAGGELLDHLQPHPAELDRAVRDLRRGARRAWINHADPQPAVSRDAYAQEFVLGAEGMTDGVVTSSLATSMASPSTEPRSGVLLIFCRTAAGASSSQRTDRSTTSGTFRWYPGWRRFTSPEGAPRA